MRPIYDYGVLTHMKVKGFAYNMIGRLLLSLMLIFSHRLLHPLPPQWIEVSVLNYFLISHSQLHLVSWALVKVFQHRCEYKGVSILFHYSFIFSKLKIAPIMLMIMIFSHTLGISRLILIAWSISNITFTWLLPWTKKRMQISAT